MERGTLIGVIGGTILWLWGAWLNTGDLSIYFDLPSVLITIGGSFASLMICIPFERIKMLRTLFGLAFQNKAFDPSSTIETLITFAEKSRREGVLALEDDVAEVPDPFLKRALQLVVDGTDPEVVKNIMYAEMDQMETRHAQARKIFDDWGYFAPSWGMIGTLIGLIAMLRSMQDVSSIGKNMATALITTLYGAILANHFLLPMSAKLYLWNQYDVIMKEIVLEGVLSIQAGDNPTILREKLNSFLPPAQRPKSEEGK
ncbi:MAG: MotA/TolQ/ExbB proton channel family protein [Brevinematales bacterium]|nr:MotA/TolQ/ExbB proton channel family protein [Brevinematales bacterium]